MRFFSNRTDNQIEWIATGNEAAFFDTCTFSENQLTTLATAIEQSTTLTTLTLSSSNLTRSEIQTILAPAILKNTSLQVLTLPTAQTDSEEYKELVEQLQAHVKSHQNTQPSLPSLQT